MRILLSTHLYYHHRTSVHLNVWLINFPRYLDGSGRVWTVLEGVTTEQLLNLTFNNRQEIISGATDGDTSGRLTLDQYFT